jgi:hypothetical protein
MSAEEFAEEIARTFADLARRQERLGEEFEQAWSDNVDELYEP